MFRLLKFCPVCQRKTWWRFVGRAKHAHTWFRFLCTGCEQLNTLQPEERWPEIVREE